MESSLHKHKCMRRASAQFFTTLEAHIENEVNHERRVTETSRLSSSWASLTLSNDKLPDSPDCSGISSPGSAGSSPISHHRPNSFSGPLMVSVTCSSNGSGMGCARLPSSIVTTTSNPLTFSRSTSCYPSPVASPVSSRIQCYSPGMGQTSCTFKKERTHSTSSGSASPLMLSQTLGKKRLYACMGGGQSSADESRESSPDPISCCRSKFLRTTEANYNCSNKGGNGSVNSFIGSPPTDFNRCTPSVSTPSSPFLSLSNPTSFLRPVSNSPSTTSLSSPYQSLSTYTGTTSSPQTTSGLQQPEFCDYMQPTIEAPATTLSSYPQTQSLSSEEIGSKPCDENYKLH